MRTRKTLMFCLVTAILLTLTVCLCPIPVRIHTSMEGMHINEPQEFVENVTVNVSGWKYNYLFLQDKIKLKFDTDESLGTLDNMRTYEYKINSSTRYASLFFYCGHLNSFSSGTVTYDKDFSSCLIELLDVDNQGSTYYVLSSDPDANLWNLYKEYLKHQ